MRQLETLWAALLNLEISPKHATFTFEDRLQKEQGWTREFTEDAVVEYKRFLFLSQCAGHPITPSKIIDEVWHLHLLYTYSYWEILCKTIFKKPLHHYPTEGNDNQKHHEQYQKTLESYRSFFKKQPPIEIWK
jgi:hypothetical protein